MSDMSKSHTDDAPHFDDEQMDMAAHLPDMATGSLQEAPASFGDAGVTHGLPPQRVRFATVAKLSFDGYEETFEVSVLNLSETGVACTGPRGMARGDKCRLSFRLHLGEAPESFLCEVVWVHEPEAMQVDQIGEEDEANYGMRFVDLDADLTERLQALVQERTDGRAAAWTLPVMPAAAGDQGQDFVLSAEADHELAPDDIAGDYFGEVLGSVVEHPPAERSMQAVWTQASRRTETWVAAGLGLAVGLGVALAAMGLGGTHPQEAVQSAAQSAAAGVQAGADATSAAAQKTADVAAELPTAAAAAPQVAVDAARPVVKVAETEARRAKDVVVEQAAKASAPVKAAVQAPAAAVQRPIAQRVRELAAASGPAAGAAKSPANMALRPRVEGSASRATLVLTADGAVKDPHVFWMADPRRLVVDIPGRGAAVEGKLFDLDHPVISRVRVGKHPDKVRFVIETGKDVTSALTTRVQGNMVRVELRRP